MSKMSKDEINEIVFDIIDSIPLRDLVSISKLDESDVEVLEMVFALYIRKKLGVERNLPYIINALWKRLIETHRLRSVD